MVSFSFGSSSVVWPRQPYLAEEGSLTESDLSSSKAPYHDQWPATRHTGADSSHKHTYTHQAQLEIIYRVPARLLSIKSIS